MVELVANLNVMGTPPAALEECYVLVKLVVLVGVELGEAAEVGRSGCAAWLLQSSRQRITRIVYGAHTVGEPHKVGSRGRPAKVVIVLKEISVTRGGNNLRG